ncbi:unnamed protein product [Caenorhabditis brenneri]
MNTVEVQEKIRQMESPDEEVDLDGDMVTVDVIELAELQHAVEVANLQHFDVLEEVRKMKEDTASTTSALESRIRDLEIERDLQEEEWGCRSVTTAGLDRLRLRHEQEEASRDREVAALEAKVEALRLEMSQIRFGDVLHKEAELARGVARKLGLENLKLKKELAELEYDSAWEAREAEELQNQFKELEGRTLGLEYQAREQALDVQRLRMGNIELNVRLEWLEAKWAEVNLFQAEVSQASSNETSESEELQAEDYQAQADGNVLKLD